MKEISGPMYGLNRNILEMYSIIYVRSSLEQNGVFTVFSSLCQSCLADLWVEVFAIFPPNISCLLNRGSRSRKGMDFPLLLICILQH